MNSGLAGKRFGQHFANHLFIQPLGCQDFVIQISEGPIVKLHEPILAVFFFGYAFRSCEHNIRRQAPGVETQFGLVFRQFRESVVR